MQRVDSTRTVNVTNPVSESNPGVTEESTQNKGGDATAPLTGSSSSRRPFLAGLSSGLAVALIVGVVLGVEYNNASNSPSSSTNQQNREVVCDWVSISIYTN